MNNNSVSPKAMPTHFPFSGPSIPTLLLRQNSPPSAIGQAYQPAAKPYNMPLSPHKPSSDYLLHLMPQAQAPRKVLAQTLPSMHPLNLQYTFRPQPQRQFLENSPSQLQNDRQFRSRAGMGENRNAISNPQAFSQTARSKGFSEFNARFNSQIQSRDNANSLYSQPKSPKQIVNIEQVRRVSQYKDVSQASDKKSQRSSSQHNIHITIQSTVEGEPVPTITISPNGKTNQESTIQTHTNVNPYVQRVVSYPPKSILTLPQPTSITQTIVSQQAPAVHMSPQPLIVNHPPTFVTHHHPVIIQPQSPTNPSSQTQLPSPKQVQYENTLASYTQSHHSALPINHNLINDTLARDRNSSLSIGDINKQKHKKILLETAARQEYYNELPEKEEEEESMASNGCENRTTGFSAYMSDEKLLMNTRRLIDEIFENETNRALLQMRVLDAKSREKAKERRKSFKKSLF